MLNCCVEDTVVLTAGGRGLVRVTPPLTISDMESNMAGPGLSGKGLTALGLLRWGTWNPSLWRTLVFAGLSDQTVREGQRPVGGREQTRVAPHWLSLGMAPVEEVTCVCAKLLVPL